MYEQILIPYDGSDEARRGAEHGIQLAKRLGSTVHALYVIDLPGVPRALSLRDDEEKLRAEYREYGERILGEICEAAESEGVECTTNIRTGSQSDQIVDFAEDEGMDVIVMGSAYRGTLGNLIGGTTDRVVRTATVPVISQRMDMNDL
ncbi:universal stress protein [Halogeometricum limi]|uniref:Nucleotide-binding universal stress protein, UspA family n=1 Tax=Halogeometricum limi TaxID=555875 RepID=A0A1I6IGH6_9EURY|nr:universal stress protein [Halogeometricum limi]SFR65420.1 Nucleotide-binding universal stress protein, UspA family [Halogeometricum limi]